MINRYYLSTFIKQFFLKLSLRKRAIIGKGCFISTNALLEGNNKIGIFSKINSNVILKKNSEVGNYSDIANLTLGENSVIETGVICTGYGKGKIIIGKESYIGIYNVLDWSDNIVIGDYVHIAGPSTGLWTHTSSPACLNNIELSNKNIKYRPIKPIIIENNVYIGGNCTIYPGVKIKHHSIVAPNSAVTKDVESYSLVGGVPAKLIKKLEK